MLTFKIPMAFACVLAAVGGSALAQSGQPLPAAPGLDSLIPKGVTVTLGAAGIYQPRYEGAKSYEFIAVPVIKFDSGSSLAKRFDVRNADDISFAVLSSDTFQLGVLTGYRFDRDQSDGSRLRGLGDVNGGIVAGGFARYNLGPAYLRGSYHRQITDDDTGGLFKFVAGIDYRMNDKVMLHAFTGIEAGDRTYMRTYFGVDANQSARSGLATYQPSGGAKSFHLGAGTEIEVAPTWTVIASAEYIRYLGNIDNSPIVEETDQVRVKLGLSKTFSMEWGGR